MKVSPSSTESEPEPSILIIFNDKAQQLSHRLVHVMDTFWLFDYLYRQFLESTILLQYASSTITWIFPISAKEPVAMCVLLFREDNGKSYPKGVNLSTKSKSKLFRLSFPRSKIQCLSLFIWSPQKG
jgi:hypothetical protein